MQDKYQKLISSFRKRKVLVLGDFILDAYIKGDIKRIAPEAPVPVVDVQNKTIQLGGAANVALNLKTLSAQVVFCSVVGNDEAGHQGLALLRDSGIATEGIFISQHKSTQAKTRIMAGLQAVVRYDTGDTEPLNPEMEQKIISFFRKSWKSFDALLLADYDKGVITDAILRCINRLQKKDPLFIAVDSKRPAYFKNLSPNLIKPNFDEAQKLLGFSVSVKEGREEQLKDYGPQLYEKTGAEIVALTLDHEGVLWFRKGKLEEHILAEHISSPQVSGAGDTFISAALLALAGGTAGTGMAGTIAAGAAAIVLQKEGTACCMASELALHFSASRKFIKQTALKAVVGRLKAEGKKVVFTNGCFDILHSGHIHFLRKAKLLGDVLIVGLNDDASISRLKGKSRPINALEERMEVLSAIGCIDYIIPFGSPGKDTASGIIAALKPDLVVKGADYKYKALAERPVLSALNIPLRFLPLSKLHSTSALIHKIQEGNFGQMKNIAG